MLSCSVNESEPTRQPVLKPPLQGRLNAFQKTMLDWNELHPYNAVHVVRVSGKAEVAQLQEVIRDALVFRGLVGLTLNRKQGSFQFAGHGAPADINVIEAGDDPFETLRAEIERQINTGFETAGAFEPFRFFVIREKNSFCLGLVYFHAVADAVSIVQLLRHIHSTLTGGARPEDMKCFRLARARRSFQPLALAQQLVRFLAQLQRQRRCVRVYHRDLNEGGNRFEQFTLGPEMLRDLAAAAKKWDVTINDVFLALLLRCCSAYTLKRFEHPSRRRIAVGCIVNTRNDLNLAEPDGWGLFLGSFVVSHEAPEGCALADLARAIRVQTQAIKQRKAYAGPPVELALGRFLLSFYSTKDRPKLYQKHYPLWGGITNMNLNSLWPQPAGGPPVDYFRGVSTGPVTPLVLSVTTVREVVNVGLTFRTSTFTVAHSQFIKNLFLQLLEQVRLSS